MTVHNTYYDGYKSGGKIPGYTATGAWIDEVFTNTTSVKWSSPTYDGVIKDIKDFSAKIHKINENAVKAQELLDNLNKSAASKWKISGSPNAPVFWKENEWNGNNTYWQDVNTNSNTYASPKNYVTSAHTWTAKVDYSEVDQKTIELLFGKKTEYVPGENCIF